MQVIANLLSEASSGASKTKLVYSANLNFKVIERYLNFLIEREMIRLAKSGSGKEEYFTTERGREFLTHYNEVEKILRLLN